MSDAKDGGSSTGVSPHRKQHRVAGSVRVTTRGLVPTMSPDPAPAADASCSPAGAVQRRHQQSTEAEVSALGALARRSEPVNEHARLACPVTAVLASILGGTATLSQASTLTPRARPLLQLPSGRHQFPDDARARSHGCGLHSDRGAPREPPGRQLREHSELVGRIQGGSAPQPLYRARTAGGSIQTVQGAADGPRGDRGGAPAVEFREHAVSAYCAQINSGKYQKKVPTRRNLKTSCLHFGPSGPRNVQSSA